MIRPHVLFRDCFNIICFFFSFFYLILNSLKKKQKKRLQGLNLFWFRQVMPEIVWHKPAQTNTKPHMDFGGVIFSLIMNIFEPIYTLHRCELISSDEEITTERR